MFSRIQPGLKGRKEAAGRQWQGVGKQCKVVGRQFFLLRKGVVWEQGVVWEVAACNSRSVRSAYASSGSKRAGVRR